MVPSRTRRDVLAAAGSTVGAIGLAGCTSLLDGTTGTETASSQTEPTTTTATSSRSDGGPSVAALDIAATDTEYAVLGKQTASKTATLYGGWKCPYTRDFVLEMLPQIIDEYVASGTLTIEFRAVRFQADESWGDDEPRANRAGLAVWHEAPEKFPAYVETVYSNQPSERTEWATVDRLIGFAKQANIAETEPIRESIVTGEYSSLWKDTMNVVEKKGIQGIPRLELGGEITAPTIDPDATKRQLNTALD